MAQRSAASQDYFPVVTEEKGEDRVYEEGRWTQNEKIKYLVFLEVHSQKFVKSSKRLWKIYKALSRYVETRNPQQCRSHHRKLLLRYQTLHGIVENGKKSFNPELYEIQLSFYKQKHLKQNTIERNYTRLPRVVTMELPSFSKEPQEQKAESPTVEIYDQNRPTDFESYQALPSINQQSFPFFNIQQMAYLSIMASNPFLMTPFANFWQPY